MVDKIPMGQVMNKGLTIRTGQTHVNRWTDDLLRHIEDMNVFFWQIVLKKSVSAVSRIVGIQDVGPNLAY